MTFGGGAYGFMPYGGLMSLHPAEGLTIEERIEAALFKSVKALDIEGAPPLAWPNVAFTPPVPASTYVRVAHLRNSNVRSFAKATDPHLRQGILQLTVVSLLRLGPNPATTLAASIAWQYPAGRSLYESGVRVRVQAAPNAVSPDKTDISWDARIDVPYECFA